MKRGRIIGLGVFAALLALACTVAAVRTALLFCLGVSMFALLVGLPVFAFRGLTVAIHELAHAGMTVLLGWRVRRIVIGHGPLWRRFTLAGANVDIRRIPAGGCVYPEPTTMRWRRLKYVMISLAGPAAEAAIVVLLFCCLRLVEAYLPGNEGPKLFLWLLICGGVCGVGMSLIPFAYSIDGGVIDNDGLAILKTCFHPQSIAIPRYDLSTVAEQAKYSPDAFEFVNRAIDIAANAGNEGSPAHIRGQQFCWFLRDYALELYGNEARAVLQSWGVTSSEDFGRIVFAMVEAGFIGKSEKDSIHDFDNVYAFDEAFATAK